MKSDEDPGVIVKDIDAYNRRMQRIQTKIDAAEMLGIGVGEFERSLFRPVILGKGLTIGEREDKIKMTVHTIRQRKTSEGGMGFTIGCDVWQEKG